MCSRTWRRAPIQLFQFLAVAAHARAMRKPQDTSSIYLSTPRQLYTELLLMVKDLRAFFAVK